MGTDILYLLSLIAFGVIMWFSSIFDNIKREIKLHQKGWIRKKVDGVDGYEKNGHFISIKRLKTMSDYSFFKRLKVGN